MHNIGNLGIRRLLEGLPRGVYAVHDQELPRSTLAKGTVRTLRQQEELPLLRDHLLRLDRESRHDRFNGFIDDSFIAPCAAQCAADGTSTIAFSAETCVRRQGVGSILFRKLIAEARSKGYHSLRITTGAQNQAMRALANKFGAHLTFRHGESTGSIDLKQHPQSELARYAIATPAAAARAIVDFNRAYWKLFLRMYGWGRTA